MAILSFRDVTVRFVGPPLLDGISLEIEAGERVALVGRNGAGKSTFMKLVNGELATDHGDVVLTAGVRTARLSQEVPIGLSGTVFEQVAAGFGEAQAAIVEYDRAHRLDIAEVYDSWDDDGQAEAHDHEPWKLQRKVLQVISRMQLDPEAEVSVLSAGMKRRVLLAQSLVHEPAILLLDEPTNHLDIEAIRWLEDFLGRFGGTLLFVTHDRAFLRKLATRIVEIDRGRVLSWACDYDTFLLRKEAALEAEAQQNALFDKKLAQEEAWIRQGIKARRTRNEGRVRALEKLRVERSTRRERIGSVRIEAQEAQRSGRLVSEAEEVTFSYAGAEPVIRDFSATIMRGDRIGIIGPNGSGKTTLLRLLLGELPPTTGGVRLGTQLQIAYFDQLHAQLDEEKSVEDNVADGNNRVLIDGKSRHVLGYLQDFLFPPDRARSLVKVLSGGERNRLLLAKLFTKPSNLLVMDEPTNDLDIETLELLEELLLDYPGTVLLVSHDREFLNRVVTSTLVFEGEGRVKDYAGGYDDWLRQRKAAASRAAQVGNVAPTVSPGATANKPPAAPAKKAEPARKLSYKEKQELERLPKRIEELESEQESIHAEMAAPGFFQQPGPQLAHVKSRLEQIGDELRAAYQRWELLETADKKQTGA